jgi:pimeloyl-ACP methyl ester carboxylesterase
MHIYCTGSGSLTIVLEAGGQNDSVIWRGVQPALSRTTRVCAYDRAGFGWSDAQPGPRDADHIAAELHQLLLQTGITGPVVLMGHSVGGIFLRDYVTHYPTNVVGIVFVDSSTPFQNKNPAMKLAGSGPPSWVFNLAMIAGVPRLIGMCGSMQGVEGHTMKLQAEAIAACTTAHLPRWTASTFPACRRCIPDLTAHYQFSSSRMILRNNCPQIPPRGTLIDRTLGARCRRTSRSFPRVAAESSPKTARIRSRWSAQT